MKKSKVARIIAGDAFETDSGHLVFLDGVDAPDIWSPGAEEAVAKLRAVLKEGQEVSLSFTDVGLGRFIAKVWAGGISINEEMEKFYPEKRPAQMSGFNR